MLRPILSYTELVRILFLAWKVFFSFIYLDKISLILNTFKLKCGRLMYMDILGMSSVFPELPTFQNKNDALMQLMFSSDVSGFEK